NPATHEGEQVGAGAALVDPRVLDQALGVDVEDPGGVVCSLHVAADPEQRLGDPAQHCGLARRLGASLRVSRGARSFNCCCCCDCPTTVSLAGPGSWTGGSSARSTVVNSIRVRSGCSGSLAGRGGLSTQVS